MKCRKIKKNLIFLAERSLSADEEKKLLLHLESCADCRKQYEFLKAAELLIIEEKSSDINPYFYSAITGRLGSLESDDHPEYKPAWIKIAHGSILVVIIFTAVMFGLALGANNSKYMSSKQNINQQMKGINNEYIITDKQFANSFSRY